MRNNGKGGMQCTAARGATICPKCSKPAARKTGNAYMHYTKAGVIWHVLVDGTWKRQRNAPTGAESEGAR